MRLLVTRPEADAEETAARLRALGHEPVVFPLLQVVLTPPPAVEVRPAAILFTSRNAVRAVSGWPAARTWRDVPALAGGEATAALLRENGFTKVRSADGAARELAVLAAAALPARTGPLLYPTAPERMPHLETMLANRGYDVRAVIAYKAEPASGLPAEIVSDLKTGTLAGVLLYSRRSAATFAKLVLAAGLGLLAPETRLLALSGQVATPLAGLGGTIQIAEHPNEESLLALLPHAA